MDSRKTVIEDLGVQARDGLWMKWIHGQHPKTGAELAIGSLAGGGFVVVDPAARTSFVVRPEISCETGWAIGQAPDGRIYQAGVHGGRGRFPLLCWNWEGDVARVVADRTFKSVFTLDVAPDGRVYMPEYTGNVMYRYDPATSQIESLGSYADFGAHIRNVACAPDGWVYVNATDYKTTCLVGLDPRTGARSKVSLIPPEFAGWAGDPTPHRDANGRVLVALRRWGRACWVELRGGATHAIDQKDVAFVQGDGGGASPLAFRDGSYISRIDRTTVTRVDPAGRSEDFAVEWIRSPLRIFSVYSAAGRVWGGTFIPLTLFSYDPATGRSDELGNPTTTNGEIYSMSYAEGKLFIGSYYAAHLNRYTPGQPWKRDGSVTSNPANLGLMKDGPLPLMRPYGTAISADGMVFFSACGGYGCTDAGLSRIDPRTEQVTRWIFPGTSFGGMFYLSARDQLVVVEQRLSERALRITFISPQTGGIVASEPIIEDEGSITSWLHDGGDLIYGLHDYRATLFAYSLSENRIVRKLPELGLGDHCHRCLVFGPDDRIWGLTARCVFSVDRALTDKRVLGEYEDHASGNAYRFGFVQGPDGHLYFPNGTHLMRVRVGETKCQQ